MLLRNVMQKVGTRATSSGCSKVIQLESLASIKRSFSTKEETEVVPEESETKVNNLTKSARSPSIRKTPTSGSALNYYNHLNSTARNILDRYDPDNEGRTLLIESENSSKPYAYLPVTFVTLSSVGYAFGLLGGMLPLTVIAGYPLLAHYILKKYSKQNQNAQLNTISHVYVRQVNGENVFDVVVRGNDKVKEVIQGVSEGDLKFEDANEVKVELSLGLQIANLQKTGTLPLKTAYNHGFPGQFLPVSIRGKTYFLDSGYRGNKQLLASLNL